MNIATYAAEKINQIKMPLAIVLALAMLTWLAPALAAQDVALCSRGPANCFFSGERPPLSSDAGASGPSESLTAARPMVTLQLRALHSGPFAHHWIELGSSHGETTIGFGPATLPFIDAGKISVWDAHGKTERVSWLHLFSPHFNYAKAPGAGHSIGQPVQLTIFQADALIEKMRHRRFIAPYIPIFHDCRTFVCALQSSVRGKSTLPCYFLFKGYW